MEVLGLDPSFLIEWLIIISLTWDKGLPKKTLIEGIKTVRQAIKIPKNKINELLILKGSSSSLSNSLKLVLREDSWTKFIFTNCFDFGYVKSLIL